MHNVRTFFRIGNIHHDRLLGLKLYTKAGVGFRLQHDFVASIDDAGEHGVSLGLIKESVPVDVGDAEVFPYTTKSIPAVHGPTALQRCYAGNMAPLPTNSYGIGQSFCTAIMNTLGPDCGTKWDAFSKMAPQRYYRSTSAI